MLELLYNVILHRKHATRTYYNFRRKIPAILSYHLQSCVCIFLINILYTNNILLYIYYYINCILSSDLDDFKNRRFL